MVKTGRPPALTIEDKENLKALAVGNPLLTLRELHALFSERHRITISLATMWHCLTGMGLTRPKTFGSHAPTRAHPNVHTPNLPPPPAPAHQPHHYGYQKEHRYQPPAPQYPSSLTDAEWALVADLFDHPGPGHPPKFSRRQILDACRYVMRAGCSWRMLPHDFPPWATVYAVFKRWSRKGLFEQMHERLRQMYRQHEGKSPHPSAALLDSQTVKTGPQGEIETQRWKLQRKPSVNSQR
jgi:transposase